MGMVNTCLAVVVVRHALFLRQVRGKDQPVVYLLYTYTAWNQTMKPAEQFRTRAKAPDMLSTWPLGKQERQL